VRPNDAPITRERAYEIAKHQIKTQYYPKVLEYSEGMLKTDGQKAAIVDFAYNVGINAFKTSTLRKRILSGNFDDVENQLMRWTKGGGKTLPGLVKRRKAEWLVFNL
jgi:lysozyme